MSYRVFMRTEAPGGLLVIDKGETSVTEPFDSLGMALARAALLDYVMPRQPDARHTFNVRDAMGGICFPGDEWDEMCDNATLLRLFPDGFDADTEYGRRVVESCDILADFRKENH